MSTLVLRPHGNLGNHMLQLVTARSLQERVPDLRVTRYDIPEFGLKQQTGLRFLPKMPRIYTQDADLDHAVELICSGEMPLAKLRCMVLQCETYADLSIFRQLFSDRPNKVLEVADDEVLINIRGAEILGPRSAHYGPLQLGFYQGIIDQTGKTPVFMGQIGDDWYSDLLRKTFPSARFLPSQGAIKDFETIRRARHIVMCVSTFSWVAAWLSEAETIHMPLSGMFNPDQRPDVWLLPRSDARFHYYFFQPRFWAATPEQIEDLHDVQMPQKLTATEVNALRARSLAARATDVMAAREKLEAAAARFLPVGRVFG